MKPVAIRQATLADVPGIIELDQSAYGEVQLDQPDDLAAMFRARIKNCHGTFWVAEHEGQVVGLMCYQATKYTPDDFVSWEQCTNVGTFEGTYDPTSRTAYVAALTVNKVGSQLDATDALLASAVAQGIRDGIRSAFFSGRMPKYHEYARTMTPEDYYETTTVIDGRTVALDPQIRMYEGLGMKRTRLVPNGFAADTESLGNAVLFTFTVPFAGWPLSSIWASIFEQVARRPRLFALLSRWA